jgi:hypothetical protein
MPPYKSQLAAPLATPRPATALRHTATTRAALDHGAGREMAVGFRRRLATLSWTYTPTSPALHRASREGGYEGLAGGQLGLVGPNGSTSSPMTW